MSRRLASADGLAQAASGEDARADATLLALRTRRMYEALSAVGEAATRAADEATLLGAAGDALFELGGFRRIAFFRFDATASLLRQVAVSESAPTPVLELPVPHDGQPHAGHPLVTGAHLKGATCVIQDYSVADIDQRFRDMAQRYGIAAGLAVPIRDGNGPVLVLSLMADERNWFEPQLVALAERAASLIGIALAGFELDAARRAVERRLQESEERFRRLTRLSSDWVWRTDAEHRLVEVGSANADDTPLPVAQLGFARWELPSVQGLENDWAEHRRAMDAHEPFRGFEYCGRDATGEVLWGSVNGDPLFDDEGNFTGYLGTSTEITARRRAEERSGRLTRLYAALGAASEAVSRGTDEEGLYAAVCEALHDIAGIAVVAVHALDAGATRVVPRAARGIDVASLRAFHPVQADVEHASMLPTERAFRDGRACHVPDYFRDPQLHGHWPRARDQGIASLLAVPLWREGAVQGVLSVAARQPGYFDDELSQLVARVAAVLGSALDRLAAEAQRVAAQDRLAASEARFRHLTELSADWMWETDAHHRLLSVTLPLGKADAPVAEIGCTRWESARVQGLENDWAAHRAVVAAHQPFRDFQYCGRDDAGELRWFSVNGDPVCDGDGRFAGYIGTTSDISARRRAEERAARLTRLYAALGAVKDTVVHGRPQEELFPAVCDALHDIGGFDLVCVRMADETGRWLTPVATGGIALSAVSRQRVDGAGAPGAADAHPLEPNSRAFREGRTCRVPNYETDPGLGESRARARAQGATSVLAVPLRREGVVCGVLSVASAVADYFDSELTGLVERVAADLSRALDMLAAEAQRRAVQEQLLASEERFRRLSEMSVDYIWERDAELRLTYLSPSYFEATGTRPEDMLGKRPGEIPSVAGGKPYWYPFHDPLRAHLPFRDIEYSQQDPDGVLRWRVVSGDPVFDAQGRFCGFHGIARDVTERKRFEEELRRQATFDALTGLPNRTLLRDRIGHALERALRSGRQVAVLLVDLDKFKLINDSLGHDAGDAVLRCVGARLAACVRPEDTVGRLGGDEFVVVLEDTTDDSVQEVASRLLEVVAGTQQVEDRELHVAASIGVACHPRDGDDAATLLRNADAAMYQAKVAGGDGLHFYTAALNQRAARYVAVRAELHQALERREFVLHYQPIVACAQGRIVGAEALLRWRRGDGTLALPGEFIDVAEDTGLIVPIGAWVLREACMQARSWSDAGHDLLSVSVNLSARQFRHGDLAESVRAVLAETGLAAQQLALELTESTMMSDLDAAAVTLGRIDELGVRVAIDDFGTGHSSLAYLKRFPVSELKIDRSFVRDAPHDVDDAAIVRAIIDLARALGVRVVAEGVETEEQVALLRALGCDWMQGYHLGRPLPPAAFRALLDGGPRAASDGQRGGA